MRSFNMQNSLKKMKVSLKNIKIPVSLMYCMYKLLTMTYRYTEKGREEIDRLNNEGKPLIFCLWHDELFPLMKVQRNLDIVTVVSASNDGGILASVLERLGLRTVRGSSSRKGMSALLNAVKLIKKEKVHACMTIDGPQGPRHVPKDGAFFLAFHAGALIAPVRLNMRCSCKLKTWDKFQVPLPFSKIDIEFMKPYAIESTILNTETIQIEREKLGELLKPAPEENSVSKNISNDDQSPFTLWEKIQYFLLVQLGRSIAFLGFSFARYLGNFIGFLIWHLFRKRRRLAIDNIKQSFNISRKEARKIARLSFAHNGRSFVEIVLVPRFSFNPKGAELKIAEPELLEQLRTSSRPTVATTAHQGSWELLAALEGEIYQDRPRAIVVRQYPNRAVQKFITDLRESHGAQMVSHKFLAATVIRTLKQNGLTAFLVDHHAHSHEALQIPFFDRIANVNMGPALLALRAEALIFPTFLVRDGADKNAYIFHIQEPLDTRLLKGSSREEKVLEIAEFYTHAVEKIIRQYPEQWFWMHNRWKN